MTEQIAKMEPMAPTYIGLLWRGTTRATKTVAPEKIPADPRPATARPVIKAFEFGAAPHNRDPISKKAMATSITHLGE